jgi:thioredoxin-related protein
MLYLRNITASLLAILCLTSLVFAPTPEPKKDEVKWYSLEEAVALQEKEPRKIFIDIYTDWCGWCKKMDKNTFANPIISKQLNEKFYAVKLDAHQKEDINLKGTLFKYVEGENGGRGYHQAAIALLGGKMSFPTVVFLDEEARLVQAIPGYLEPKPFDQMLNFFSTNAHQKQSWDDFIAQYQSPFDK